MIKLELTEEQFKALAKLVFLGVHMVENKESDYHPPEHSDLFDDEDFNDIVSEYDLDDEEEYDEEEEEFEGEEELIEEIEVSESDFDMIEVAQMIFEKADESGLELPDFEAGTEEMTEDQVEFFEDVENSFEGYTENVFWTNLVEKLAIEELVNTYSKEQLDHFSTEEKLSKNLQLLLKYSNEFAENGLKNVTVNIKENQF